MKEEIFELKDFKRLLGERKLNIKDVRLDFHDEPVKDNRGQLGGFARCNASLTIPHGQNIMEFYISGRTYCVPFMRDKDSEERKSMDEWIGKIKEFCKKEFRQEITLGRWSK